MRFGFVLDQTRCIGCHACTVACKSENSVPLGVFRTWVKYIEKGEFPETRRFFSVMRCNQCDDAPCVKICPTSALFRRPDGIVDFDNNVCIGCKSCMQACPYDALYIDPTNHTAAKCNYCAHRIDRGLEPACVVVCPTQAIVPGDLDDPQSRIAQIVARKPVSVRKPEQGTKPKVYYLGADEASLTPSIERQAPEFLFATTPTRTVESHPDSKIRETYDVPHETPWGWRIWTYLWTKSIGAGAIMIAALLGAFHRNHDLLGIFAGAAALLFTTITTILLTLDLKRPERFWMILTRPNLKSWVVLGTYVLMAFTAITLPWMGLRWSHALAWPGFLLGAAAAGYTAFLFWQCEGRDFWQGPMLLVHLLVEALLCGAAVLLLGAVFVDVSRPLERWIAWITAGTAVLHLLTVLGEIVASRGHVDSRHAANLVLHSRTFLPVIVGAGTIAPLLFVGFGLYPLAALGALAGAFEYGRLWVKAGQAVPLS